MTKQDYLKFQSFVRELFQEFYSIENIDFDKYIEEISWLNWFYSFRRKM